MHTSLHGATLRQVWKWLSLDYDVVVTGDRGSGRSTLVAALQERAAQVGWNVVRIRGERWARQQWGALLMHEAIQTAKPATPWTMHTLSAAIHENLNGVRNLLIVDDAWLLDKASINVLGLVLRGGNVRLCVVEGRSSHKASPSRLLLQQQYTSRVDLAPLTYAEVTNLLTPYLGGRVEPELISSITSESGGNPAIVRALVDTGRHAGVIQILDGAWRRVPDSSRVSTDLATHLLVDDLPDGVIDTLTMLSRVGPLLPADICRIAGQDELRLLLSEGRIVPVSHESNSSLAVWPPALAYGLLDALGPGGLQLLDARIEARVGPVRPGDSELLGDSPRLGDSVRPGDPLDAEAGQSRLWTSDLVGRPSYLTALIREQAATQDAIRLATWREDPTVENAVAYLDDLVNRPEPAVLDEVFAHTRRVQADPVLQSAIFGFQNAVWRQVCEGESRGALPEAGMFSPATSGVRSPELWQDADMCEAADTLRAAAAGGGVTGSEIIALGAWRAVVNCATLLEGGDIDGALDLCQSSVDENTPDWASRLFSGLYCDGLVLAGRLSEAEEYSRAELSEASANLDSPRIRAHSLRVAEILWRTARDDEAWTALNIPLELGPPSPFEPGCGGRTLALGAILSAERGDVTTADALVRELDGLPSTFPAVPFPTVLGGMRDLAHAAIAYARGADDRAEKILVTSARAYAAKDCLASAVLCWGSRRSSYPLAFLREYLEVAEQADIPLFRSHSELHGQLTSGTISGLRSALLNVDSAISASLIGAVLQVTGDDAASLYECSNPLLQCRVGTLRESKSGVELTERERQIAALVALGHSNKQIAERVVLSIRTVENHLHRTMRKLGVHTRAELADALHHW